MLYSILYPKQSVFVVVQSLSLVRLFVTPWTTICQASLSFTISQSLPKFLSIASVMPSNHLILCCPLLLSVFPSIKVFSSESAVCIRWPKYWNFRFSSSKVSLKTVTQTSSALVHPHWLPKAIRKEFKPLSWAQTRALSCVLWLGTYPFLLTDLQTYLGSVVFPTSPLPAHSIHRNSIKEDKPTSASCSPSPPHRLPSPHWDSLDLLSWACGNWLGLATQPSRSFVPSLDLGFQN